jgi:uncharacterized protein DUF5681
MSDPKKDAAQEFDAEFIDPCKAFDDEFYHPFVTKVANRSADPLGDHADKPAVQTSGAADSEETHEGVGYGRPPKKHQFKPGQSGNKRGRPKGAKNESTILREILLQRKVPMRDGGRMRKVQVLEGMLLRFAEDSLKGNTKSAAFLLNRFGQYVSGEIQRDGLNPDDREILDSYLGKFKKQDDAP